MLVNDLYEILVGGFASAHVYFICQNINLNDFRLRFEKLHIDLLFERFSNLKNKIRIN